MSTVILQGLSGALLLLTAAKATAHTQMSTLIFKFGASIVGSLSCAHAYARFMGWVQ